MGTCMAVRMGDTVMFSLWHAAPSISNTDEWLVANEQERLMGDLPAEAATRCEISARSVFASMPLARPCYVNGSYDDRRAGRLTLNDMLKVFGRRFDSSFGPLIRASRSVDKDT